MGASPHVSRSGMRSHSLSVRLIRAAYSLQDAGYSVLDAMLRHCANHQEVSCSAPLLDRRSVALERSASLLAASPPRWKAKSYLFQSASTMRIHISGDSQSVVWSPHLSPDLRRRYQHRLTWHGNAHTFQRDSDEEDPKAISLDQLINKRHPQRDMHHGRNAVLPAVPAARPSSSHLSITGYTR